MFSRLRWIGVETRQEHGVTTMKMIRSTSMTSTRGVTLGVVEPLPPPPADIAMELSSAKGV